MNGNHYQTGLIAGIEICIDFLNTLPEEDLHKVPAKFLIQMIKIKVEGFKKEFGSAQEEPPKKAGKEEKTC